MCGAGAKVRIIVELTKFCTMKVVELLKLGAEMLKLMSENEVNRDDWRFVPLHEEFQEMRRKGVKYREAVRMLAEEYHVSRATVERAIKRLEGEC